MTGGEPYAGREQTLVKHEILRRYLERFAYIVGSHWDVITYVDCFSGPWNVRSDEYADSSFAIALEELRKAKGALSSRRRVKLRCFFLEKDRSAYARLRAFAEAIDPDDAEVVTRNATLEESVDDILGFVRRGGGRSFPFIFIDPTGWTGFEMATIKPLLQLDPGEVLINLMTGHIRRFLDSPLDDTQQSLRRLFGSGTFQREIAQLHGADRDDYIVDEYASIARLHGDFTFSSNAIVLHPEIDRAHFHLIYLTRHRRGIEVFKDAEKIAMKVMEAARAAVQQRKRMERTQTIEMFDSSQLHASSYYDSLRQRYLDNSGALVECELRLKRSVLYDDAWALALTIPLVWESDLKDWIAEWRRQGELQIRNMEPRQRVPKLDSSNILVWR